VTRGADDELGSQDTEVAWQPDDADAPLPDRFGTYQLGALIAQGGMGRIYRAHDTTLGRDVALKVPRSGAPAMVKRFEREAAITARLQHPGIVPIHAAGHSEDGTPFYIMRLVDGRTLDHIVDETRDPAQRLRLIEHVIAIADTMAYVHEKRIVHRDLKPNNVLVGGFDETLIIDWGLAKQLSDDRSSLPAIGFGSSVDQPGHKEALRTKAGDVLGTPAFMPPEQASGEPVDERGDVYALGAILRFVLSGKVIAPNEEIKGPPELLAICKRALSPDPADRYANAGELVAALRASQAAKPTPASPRRWIWIAAVAAVAAIGVIAWRVLAASAPSAVADRVVIARLPSDIVRPALSPSGARVAYGSRDRIEVRDLGTGQRWTRPAWMGWPFTVEFPDDETVMFTEPRPHGTSGRVRWNLATDTLEHIPGELARYWIGNALEGSVWMPDQNARAFEIETPNGIVQLPSESQRSLRLFSISPDGRRIAFVEHTPAGEALRIVEGSRGPTFSKRLDDVAAITWFDSDHVLYATGTLDGSVLTRAKITADGFGPPEALFHTGPGGWLGTLASRNGRIVGSWIMSSFESRLHERRAHTERHLDKVAASAPLGWRDVVTYWVFNNATRQIERHSRQVSQLPTVAALTLPSDPANATMAGDLLIVTLRAGEGREVIAFDPAEKTPRWTAPKGALRFVRCAGDRAAPCIAGKQHPSGTVSVVKIDPLTGTLGEELVPAGEISDAAIDTLGGKMAWAVDNMNLHVRTLDGSEPDQLLDPKRSGLLSLAFDPTGGILASATSHDGRVIFRYLDGRTETVANAGPTIISLIRPSPDGTHLLYRARTLTSDLIEIRLR
jgi:serine/threonine protein kinase